MTHEHVSTTNPDVVVIGGGPSGSTVSTLIAQRGYRVQLFERERFPRFHIGESLIPETYWVLKRLNMLEKMQQSHFVKKYSVQFVNAQGRESAPFASLRAEGYLTQADPDGVTLSRDGLMRVDSLLPRFFRPEHTNIRYT